MKGKALNDFIEDNFFIITSDNLDDVQSRIYGYALHDNHFYIDSRLDFNLAQDAIGTFIKVSHTDQLIRIEQSTPSYGLYYFRKDNWFAISNSFLYLAEYLSGRFPLSLNERYAKYLVAVIWAYYSCEETIINEIFSLPQNFYAVIDKSAKRLEFVRKRPRKSIDLDSREGIRILDEWHLKWSSFVLQLSREQNVGFSLSGGFDSRAAFSTFINPLLDLNGENIKVNTFVKDKYGRKFEEDYDIASKIAKCFGFTLNRPRQDQYFCIDSETALYISFLVKLCVHNQLYLQNRYHSKKSI